MVFLKTDDFSFIKFNFLFIGRYTVKNAFRQRHGQKNRSTWYSQNCKIFFFLLNFILLFFLTAGSYQLYVLYILVYICQSQSPNSSLPPCFSPLVSINLLSTSVSLFLPCKLVHLYHFSRFHIHALIHNICFSLSDFTLYDSLQAHPCLCK